MDRSYRFPPVLGLGGGGCRAHFWGVGRSYTAIKGVGCLGGLSCRL